MRITVPGANEGKVSDVRPTNYTSMLFADYTTNHNVYMGAWLRFSATK